MPNPIESNANLEAYYRSDTGLYQDTGATTPADEDGDPIALWQDQSGNGYDLTQSTSGERPTFGANLFKGLPAVNFDDASSQWLTNTSFPWTQSKSSGAWVIAAQIDTGCPSAGLITTTQDQLGILCIDMGLYAYFNSAAAQYSSGVMVSRQGFVTALVYDGSQSTDATKFRLFRNLSQYTLAMTYGPIPATTFSGGATLYMGRQSAGGYLKGRIIEAAFFSSLSDSDRIAVTNYLGETYFQRDTYDLITKGDSRTAGYPGTWNQVPPLTGTDSYPLHAQVLLDESLWNLHNLGAGGTTLQSWAGAPADVTSLQDDWAAGQAVIGFGGINDRVAGRTPAESEADMTTWIAAILGAGFSYFLVGTEPWDLITSSTDLADFTTWIRANVAGLGAMLVDFQADPRFADATAAGDGTYYAGDGTHLTDAGNAALAEILVPHIIGIYPPPNSGNARSFPRGLLRGLNRGVI